MYREAPNLSGLHSIKKIFLMRLCGIKRRRHVSINLTSHLGPLSNHHFFLFSTQHPSFLANMEKFLFIIFKVLKNAFIKLIKFSSFYLFHSNWVFFHLTSLILFSFFRFYVSIFKSWTTITNANFPQNLCA